MGNPWHYYPVFEEYITNRDWDHATEYGKTLATKIIDPNFHTFIINVMKDKIKKDGSDGLMLDWWHNHHQSSSGYSKQQVGNARRAIAKKLREALGRRNYFRKCKLGKRPENNRVYKWSFLELSKSPHDRSSHRLYNSKELRDMENLIVYYEKNLQFSINSFRRLGKTTQILLKIEIHPKIEKWPIINSYECGYSNKWLYSLCR